ncbi:MAG: rhodanese-like domain-containing protein [Acutalibacteraceae bacterium]|nr:rhodanese-like domain-containing protein [Acutalibacteraceae bacterium]
MIKKSFAVILATLLVMVLAACSTSQSPSSSEAPSSAPQSETPSSTPQSETPSSAPQSENTEESSMSSEAQATNALGALTPEDALDYMKKTENLVIVDVATANRYNAEHFEGAINIPIEELDGEAEDALYMEIPAGRPVLLHCRLGMIVPGAYARVLELRQDIPEIAYIDGTPLFSDYNAWLAEQVE